jgi:hypothetical protein
MWIRIGEENLRKKKLELEYKERQDKNVSRIIVQFLGV